MVFVFLWLFLVSTGCGLSKHITLNLCAYSMVVFVDSYKKKKNRM